MKGRAWLIVVTAAALLLPASAQAITYAPVDQPGPPLSVPQSDLAASLTCTGNLASGPTPVLLVPGTAYTPRTDFSWGWEPALDKLGISWCAVELPGIALGDSQVAGEYVVNAIRTMYGSAGRRIAIIGHSQGGMVPRWAFRFWPDTRAMVDDLIGLSPSNHGTYDSDFACLPGCPPAAWQQAEKAEFIKALNSYQETFPGISYTNAYTNTDEIVTPNFGGSPSSALHGGGGEITNVAIQDICPLDLNEHLAIGTYDPVAYALAIDALFHTGPADGPRVGLAPCAQALMPGVDPVTFPTDNASSVASVAQAYGTYPPVPAEPPLKCYVTAGCPQAGVAAVAAKKAKCKKRKRAHRAETSKRRHCKKRRKKR
ncbi:MAG: lipase family alpha/beta hydrolase [Solirubrobacterales bacterium]